MRRVIGPATTACLSVALLFSWQPAASAADGISTTVSGYGTVGGTFTSDSDYAYHHDPSEWTAASNPIDIGLESRLGVQVIVDFGSGFSVTGQELAKERAANEFSPGTEWLFVQYSPDADLKLRLGRVVLATFLESDSRNVGYTAPWFNAPNEVYGSEEFDYLDGAQALWHHNYGQVGIGLEASYGSTSAPYAVDGETITINAKQAYNLAVSFEYQDLLLRVAQTDLNVPLTVTLSSSLSFPFSLHDSFTSVGLQYDNGTAILMSEWAQRTENSVPYVNAPELQSRQWYVAGGWRFGKLTPLLTYGVFNPSASLVEPKGYYGTFSTSLRYDVVRNVALKAEISRAQAGNETYWLAPSATSNERINVYSLGADFVF
jgi:hypothetical protein